MPREGYELAYLPFSLRAVVAGLQLVPGFERDVGRAQSPCITSSTTWVIAIP